MSCIKCTIHIQENQNICDDIFNLLSKLDIPIQEQLVIWNMAIKNIGCEKFKNLLFVLIKKQRKEISLPKKSNDKIS